MSSPQQSIPCFAGDGAQSEQLLAPASVEFFSTEGQRLGDKRSLEQQITEITGISVLALRGAALAEFDVEERFKWAATRKTTHEEDWAYCLLGIFGIFMPLIYGEGKAHAVRRLQKEIAEAMTRNNAPNYKAAKNRVWMVPFEKNPSFTGRESDLKKLREALFTGHQTAKVAITGLGGVGKTQLALALVYRTREEHENCSVIWMPTTSKESIGQAYLNAAQQLGISGWEDNKADVKRLVQDHLSSESAGQWLLVFDNADDVSMWVDKSPGESGRLIDYLPKSRHGSIVFTTRDKKTAVRLAGRNMVELSAMDEVGSKQLLQNYLVDQDLLDNQASDAEALLARLTYLPLAITQAAAYINTNGIGLRDYLVLLDEQEEDVIDLLSEDFEDERRYVDVTNAVATTWLISFEQVRQRDSLAADYLAMETYKMKLGVDHPDTLTSMAELAFTYRNQGRWEEAEKLEVQVLETQKTKLGADHPDTLTSMAELALTYRNQGRWEEAEKLEVQVLETQKTKLGVDHRDTLTSMADLASTYRNQGRWEEAEKLEVQVLETQKTKLGADHPDTLTSMGNLASTYWNQGRWEEAEKLNQGRWEEAEKFNLALTYWNQGRWEEAEKLFVQVMETQKIKLGADHPDTLTSMGNLALTYESQGRWEEAEKLFVQVMETQKIKLGADHPDTLTSMGNLALTYESQGRWEEAEKLFIQVMET
ncbi:hypothetical protein SEUCBS140593_007027 [Sporothrix eucalyptigena]|uniref:NB-ARC domain-containing protein n=1 Tax=Sporothrix eucalyptigena TaxID=1812306 RepID=A0ABP0CBC4_9PEZI